MNRLKQLRKEKQITQEELAQKLGLSKGIISLYEKEERNPSLDIIKKLCNIFDCSIDYLMGITNIRKPINGLNTANLNKEEKEEIYNLYEYMQKQKELDTLEKQNFRSKYYKETEGLTDEEIVAALKFYKEMKKKIKGDN